VKLSFVIIAATAEEYPGPVVREYQIDPGNSSVKWKLQLVK
jgi:hypothetical protein